MVSEEIENVNNGNLLTPHDGIYQDTDSIYYQESKLDAVSCAILRIANQKKYKKEVK